MSYGLTDAGFVRKTLAVVKEELEDSYKDAFGESIELGGDSVFGQLIGIHSEREALLWELAEAVYLSPFPDYATGVSLEHSSALTGTTPLKATFTTGTATATGTPGTILPSGRVISVDGSGARFVTQQEYVIGAGGTVEMAVRAEEAGPVEAPAGTLTVIETPVAGWDSVTNAVDATVGRNKETTTELRQRRAERLVIAQGGPIAAIEARLRDVDGVVFAGVTENRTNATVDDLPPKSIKVFVIGGLDADIFAALWASHTGGIEMVGDEVGTVIDSFGREQTVKFSRGTETPIYLHVVPVRGTSYPADGDDLIATALLDYVSTFENGQDLVNWLLVKAVPEIPGLEGLTIYQGTDPDPTATTNIVIPGDSLATFALERITFEP